jgi:ABC-2 type transport system ATP-binding protein
MEEAETYCDRVALLHRGSVRAHGTPEELRARLGPTATLEDVFRHWTGDDLGSGEVFRDVRATRRTVGRRG